MNKIDWAAKLSSRKLWCGIAAWLTSLLTAFNISDNNIAQIVLIVSGIGSLCVYMLSEAIVDATANKNDNTSVTDDIIADSNIAENSDSSDNSDSDDV